MHLPKSITWPKVPIILNYLGTEYLGLNLCIKHKSNEDEKVEVRNSDKSYRGQTLDGRSGAK